MEAAIRELMGAGTPPRFKFKDTYASIEFPAGYTVPAQATLEAKYNELLALEEDIQKTAIEGDLEVGTSNLFVDTETGRVGVGTNNPLGKAHIYLDDAASGTQLFIENASTSNRTGLTLRNGYGEDFRIQHTVGNSNAAIIQNNSTVNGGIRFYAKGDGDHQFRTTDSNTIRMIIDNDGNVGIGVANPAVKLDVNGTFTAKNKGWSITGGGGNAVYDSESDTFLSSTVNSSVYGSSVTTYNGASSSSWNSTDGVFTYPEDGLYQVTIHMFINATSSGRYGVFRVTDADGTAQETQYMVFSPENWGANYQRSWTTFVTVQSGWKSYMYPQSNSSITLYLADQHTVLKINKIC
jgi:hypothetical protein